MYTISPELTAFIVKASSGGDVALEEFLLQYLPTVNPMASMMATSKTVYVLNLQNMLLDLAIDKSVNLVDYFTHNRVMESDMTQISKTIGDGETDNYRNAMARMRDRENSWNRVEREGEENTKNYHYSVAKGKQIEDGKTYDFSANRARSKQCGFDTSISKTEGKGDSMDFSTLSRRSTSLSKTANTAPCALPGVNDASYFKYFSSGNTAKFLGGLLTVDVPPRLVTFDPSFSVTEPSCSQEESDGTEKITCDVAAPSCGQGYRSSLNWTWSASWGLNGIIGAGASVSVGGGGEFTLSHSKRTDQVCSSGSSAVTGTTYGHNNYDQTDSSYSKGANRSWTEGRNLKNSGAYAIGERVSYSRSKGEVKGLIEFCSQSDSASRKMRVATGSVDGVAKTWARTTTDSKGQSKRITTTDTTAIFWNQMVKNLRDIKKLILKRLEEQHHVDAMQVGTTNESTLFNLCTVRAYVDSTGCYL